MRLSDTNLKKRTVLGADGQVVGEVSGLFLDSSTWSVESLQVSLRREAADQLGVSRSVFHTGVLEIPSRFIQSVGDTVILAVSLEELRRNLPGETEPAPAH
ncbi:PRC-barrel domain-containing protein [Hyalangium gracile]|uniref:PRC-barrel domain-containing protein n=1 Tax=Hyalangium gracile TaxID=394092 RepID=UPI001CC942B9|nr:PRC-barrel domain containing protein [Hyalangium gracile]